MCKLTNTSFFIPEVFLELEPGWLKICLNASDYVQSASIDGLKGLVFHSSDEEWISNWISIWYTL